MKRVQLAEDLLFSGGKLYLSKVLPLGEGKRSRVGFHSMESTAGKLTARFLLGLALLLVHAFSANAQNLPRSVTAASSGIDGVGVDFFAEQSNQVIPSTKPLNAAVDVTQPSSANSANLSLVARVGAVNSLVVFDHGSNFLLLTNLAPAQIPRTNTRLIDVVESRGLPRRFLVSDGVLEAPLVMVDNRPGTPLRIRINKALQIWFGSSDPKAIRKKFTENQILQRVMMKTTDLIDFPSDEMESDFVSWEVGHLRQRAKAAGIELNSPARDRAHQAAMNLAFERYKETKKLDGKVFQSSVLQPSLGLEKYLERKQGRCFHIALTAAMILQTLEIPFTLQPGSNVIDENAFSTGGHTWIKLADTRWLDAAWKMLELPLRRHDNYSHWWWYGTPEEGNYRIPYQHFLALELL